MNTIDIKDPEIPSLNDLLQLAHQSNLIIKTSEGSKFILALISEEEDDFDKEVALHRRSQKLMNFLEERSKNSKKKTSLLEMREEFEL